MRIAVITNETDYKDGSYQKYILDLIVETAAEKGYDTITWSSAIKPVSLSLNAIILINNDANTQLSLKWFYEVQLPSILKKMKAEVAVHLNGCLSNTVKQPQLLVVANISSMQKLPGKSPAWQRYSSKKMTSFLSKAKFVISPSSFEKAILQKQFVHTANIHVIYAAASQKFRPLDWDEKEYIKRVYTGGDEFFLVKQNFTSPDELMLLLKAFSVFKKWQKSNMKLLLTGEFMFEEAQWKEKLSTYKFREDIKILRGSAETDASLLASAYAFLNFADRNSNLPWMLQALQSGTVAASTESGNIKEICADAVLYMEDKEAQTIGKNMVELYRNEGLCNRLIQQGKERAELYNYSKVKDQIWQLLTDDSIPLNKK